MQQRTKTRLELRKNARLTRALLARRKGGSRTPSAPTATPPNPPRTLAVQAEGWVRNAIAASTLTRHGRSAILAASYPVLSDRGGMAEIRDLTRGLAQVCDRLHLDCCVWAEETPAGQLDHLVYIHGASRM